MISHISRLLSGYPQVRPPVPRHRERDPPPAVLTRRLQGEVGAHRTVDQRRSHERRRRVAIRVRGGVLRIGKVLVEVLEQRRWGFHGEENCKNGTGVGGVVSLKHVKISLRGKRWRWRLRNREVITS